VFSGHFRLTTIGILIVVTLVAFEAMAVTTAMPTAARELGGLAHYAWAFSGFIVANIVGIVGAGVLSGQRGPKPSLVLGLVAFLGGLLLSGTAVTMTQLIAGRVVQGWGAGTLVTVLYVIIGETYADAMRPRIFAYMSAAWVLPGLAGPPLSGLITEHIGWRWVFLALAPLVLVSAVLIMPQLRAISARRRPDAAAHRYGRLLRAVVVACAIAVLLRAGQTPAVRWALPALAGVLALGWGLPGLVPAGTFRIRRGVPATVAMRGLLAGSLFGADAFIPLAMTVQHGWSPAVAGLPLVGSALAWSAGSWWQGRDAMHGSRSALVRAGFGFLTLGLAGAALASIPQLPGWLMYIAWLLAGIGAGLGMSSISVLMLAQTTEADRARDSAATQLSDGVVSAFTTGFGGVLIAAAVHGQIGYTTAFVALDLTMIVLSLLGFVTASRVQASMHDST
jgi:MFS family permease